MASNISPIILLIPFIAIPIAIIVAAIIFFKKTKPANIKISLKDRLANIGFTALVLLISTAFFILNIGLLRIISICIMIPLLYVLAILITNTLCLYYKSFSKEIKIYNVCFNIAAILSNLFLPDFGEDGEPYAVSHLIEGDWCSYLIVIAFVFAIIAIVFMILQHAKIAQIRKSQKNT